MGLASEAFVKFDVLSPDEELSTSVHLRVFKKPLTFWQKWVSHRPSYEVKTVLPVSRPSQERLELVTDSPILLGSHPAHRLMARISGATFSDPHALDDWELRLSDSVLKLKLRRWLISEKVDGGVEDVFAEFEVNDGKGMVSRWSSPIHDLNLDNRTLTLSQNREAFFKEHSWVPFSEHAFQSRPVWIQTLLHKPVLKRNGRDLFAGEVPWTETDLFQMESETFPYNAITIAQFRQLTQDPRVQIYFGNTRRTTDVGSYYAGYIVTREQTDHVEILSVGALPPYENLGVVEQMLESLKSRLNTSQKFLVARLPYSQQRWLEKVGFQSWPLEIESAPYWRDVHRGNAYLSPASIQTYLAGDDSSMEIASSKNVLFFGDLPKKVAPERSMESASSEDEVFKVSTGPYVDSDFDGAGALLELIEEEPPLIRDTEVVVEMLNTLRNKPSKEDVQRISTHLIDTYAHTLLSETMERTINEKSNLRTGEMIRFLEGRFRRNTGTAMVPHIRDILIKYRADKYGFTSFEASQLLLKRMEWMRKILQPSLRPFTLREAEKAADLFVRRAAFVEERDGFAVEGKEKPSSTPRWSAAESDPSEVVEEEPSKFASPLPVDNSPGALLRKGVLSLRALETPSFFDHRRFPKEIQHVFLVDKFGTDLPVVESGKLLLQASNANPYVYSTPAEDQGKPFYRWIGSAKLSEFQSIIFSSGLKSYLWTLEYLGQPKPIEIEKGYEAVSGLGQLPAPSAPVFIGHWLLDRTIKGRQLLKVVLVSEDSQWNQQVVNPRYLQPAEFSFHPGQELKLPKNPEVNCKTVLLQVARYLEQRERN